MELPAVGLSVGGKASSFVKDEFYITSIFILQFCPPCKTK